MGKALVFGPVRTEGGNPLQGAYAGVDDASFEIVERTSLLPLSFNRKLSSELIDGTLMPEVVKAKGCFSWPKCNANETPDLSACDASRYRPSQPVVRVSLFRWQVCQMSIDSKCERLGSA